jgi:hypothetical protein
MNRAEKRLIQDAIAQLLGEDYRNDVQPILEIAFRTLKTLPAEANDKIRRVQDHCAAAVSCNELHQAQIHVARAQRYLQQAKYECLVLVVADQIKSITDTIGKIDVIRRIFLDPFRTEVQLISERYRSIPPVQVERGGALSSTINDTRKAVLINTQLETLLLSIFQVMERMHDQYSMDYEQATSRDQSSDAVEHQEEEKRSAAEPNKTRPLRKKKNVAAVRRPRTKIGRFVVANQDQIVLSTTAILLLIDEKLAFVRERRPNSDDAKAALRQEIARFELLRQQVDEFRIATRMFARREAREAAIVQSTKTFMEGIQSWWTKSHQQICDRSLDMALFLSSVGVCSLAGAGGPLSVVVSGALVGGKPVVDAIKSIGKSLLKGGTSGVT